MEPQKAVDHPRFYSTISDKLPPPFLRIVVMDNPAEFLMASHSHEFYHVNHITDGKLEVEIGGKTNEVFAGQTMILPPKKPHRLYSPCGYRQIGIDIICCRDERGLSQALYSLCRHKFSVTESHVTATDYDGLMTLIEHPSLPNRMRALNLAETMLLDAMDALRATDSPGDNFIRQFNLMLSGKYPWELSLNSMCHLMGLSRAQLERMAHRHLGCGAVEYCARLRFKEICTLLKTTDYTLDTIAEKTGFCGSAHLSVFFCKRIGITPGQYRNRARI